MKWQVTTMNFWDFSSWGFFNLIAVLLASLLVAQMLKRSIPALEASLIPTSVLGGGVLLAISTVFKAITGQEMFDTSFFGGNGTAWLELLTYHTLALGFTASALKSSSSGFTKERSIEIFNTGLTTVATYLLQAFVGMIVCIVGAIFMKDLLEAAGLLLALGYGQGPGQAMNYGGIYESEYAFIGGKSFGLTIASMGFLAASIGGVIYLNILKKQGKIKLDRGSGASNETVEGQNEIPMQESIDKFTIQIALIVVSYMLAYALMSLLGNLVPGMRATIYGFNFLLGVLAGSLVKTVLNACQKRNIIHRNYTNDFLLTRATNFFYDIMVTASIAAIRMGIVGKYLPVLLALGFAGLAVTYAYVHFVCKRLFPAYAEQQFLAMFGMLTGTASTGVILLREIDGDFKTPVADNLVYQNFPAMIFGFPILLLATMAPTQPYLTLGIVFAFMIAMNILLFRSLIFKKKVKA
jgi:ESS family glutamate:Na+ symporter